MADPDVPWINSNWGSTSGVRFVTADQPTIGIARTIEEYRFTIISPDQGLRGMTVDQVLIAEQVLDHSGEHHAQVGAPSASTSPTMVRPARL